MRFLNCSKILYIRNSAGYKIYILKYFLLSISCMTQQIALKKLQFKEGQKKEGSFKKEIFVNNTKKTETVSR